MIPYGRHEITDQDIAAVTAVLRSDFLTQGQAVERFEADLCQYCHAPHAVALNSATAGLHVAYAALGLGADDVLWTSPLTFASTANAAIMCGAAVDFVDIDPTTALLCLNRLEDKLKQADRIGRLPRIVVPVHFAGQSLPMRDLYTLSQRYGFRIVEDAAHAVGGRLEDQPIGDCRYSDVCVFSFHPVKIVTTGEGGAAMTRDATLAARMRILRSQGMERQRGNMRFAHGQGDWYYEMTALGANYRLPDILAALGSSQLTRLTDYVARRHYLAQRYDQHCANLPLRALSQNNGQYSAYHLYVVCLEDASRRATMFAQLRAAGIGVQVHYIPVPFMAYYRDLGFDPAQYPQAMDYYARCFSLPLFPALHTQDQDTVISTLCRLFETA